MNIIISRDDQTFGPYSSEQVTQFLESGKLLSSDLASWEGTEEWVSLESLLSPPNDSEQSEDSEEDDSLDDFDHEKMKQWEDVFVDDEEDDEPSSDSDQFIDDGFSDDKIPESTPEEPVESVPPSIPEAFELEEEQAVSEPLRAAVELAPQDAEQEDTADLPPPPPPPPSKGSKKGKTSAAQGESETSSQQSITPRSKKIKGLNSRQTVIVVKGESILSKIYTTSLIFLILIVITCLIAVGGLFFSYESVAHVLKNIGVPSVIIETFNPTDEAESVTMGRGESEFVLSSVSRLESEKEIIDSRR
jgi:hypothetical protein